MTGPPDNHNHFIACADIRGVIAAAAAAGVGEIAFAEHVFHIEEARALHPWLRERFEPEGPPMTHAAYLATIDAARSTAEIPLRIGLEIDARADDPEYEAALAGFRARYEPSWDVVIGSVHVLDGDECIEGETVTAPPEAAWTDYLDRLTAAAQTGSYDVISHPVRLAASVPETPPWLGRRLADKVREFDDTRYVRRMHRTTLEGDVPIMAVWERASPR